MDISTLDKAKLLSALFEGAQVNGYCVSELAEPRPIHETTFDRSAGLTLPEAQHYLELHGGDFSEVDIRGRWLGVDLRGEDLDLSLYDEHFGGVGQGIVERLRSESTARD